jgi:hypothetical protein
MALAYRILDLRKRIVVFGDCGDCTIEYISGEASAPNHLLARRDARRGELCETTCRFVECQV